MELNPNKSQKLAVCLMENGSAISTSTENSINQSKMVPTPIDCKR